MQSSLWGIHPTCRNGDILLPPSHHPFASSFRITIVPPCTHRGCPREHSGATRRIPSVTFVYHRRYRQGRCVVFLAPPSGSDSRLATHVWYNNGTLGRIICTNRCVAYGSHHLARFPLGSRRLIHRP